MADKPASKPYCVFRAEGLRGFRFECRPIAEPPTPAGAVSILYRREGGRLRQCGVGAFREGVWTNSRGAPLEGDLFWTLMVTDD